MLGKGIIILTKVNEPAKINEVPIKPKLLADLASLGGLTGVGGGNGGGGGGGGNSWLMRID